MHAKAKGKGISLLSLIMVDDGIFDTLYACAFAYGSASSCLLQKEGMLEAVVPYLHMVLHAHVRSGKRECMRLLFCISEVGFACPCKFSKRGKLM